ncbi:MAG TPA: hypothetical protein GXX24_05670 [Paracoccus solventivorans]|uniref:Uncharacterized protein n=1 Tax=Paracoccus solventivorans TaxID=53463 RepID=A0A832PLQ1_9RHOB|nr:hypothetical protein [Paracoccus solventivorans]HHW33613.1 hypothetical protein [Paracoccus solventivorans]
MHLRSGSHPVFHFRDAALVRLSFSSPYVGESLSVKLRPPAQEGAFRCRGWCRQDRATLAARRIVCEAAAFSLPPRWNTLHGLSRREPFGEAAAFGSSRSILVQGLVQAEMRLARHAAHRLRDSGLKPDASLKSAS